MAEKQCFQRHNNADTPLQSPHPMLRNVYEGCTHLSGPLAEGVVMHHMLGRVASHLHGLTTERGWELQSHDATANKQTGGVAQTSEGPCAVI